MTEPSEDHEDVKRDQKSDDSTTSDLKKTTDRKKTHKNRKG